MLIRYRELVHEHNNGFKRAHRAAYTPPGQDKPPSSRSSIHLYPYTRYEPCCLLLPHTAPCKTTATTLLDKSYLSTASVDFSVYQRDETIVKKERSDAQLGGGGGMPCVAP